MTTKKKWIKISGSSDDTTLIEPEKMKLPEGWFYLGKEEFKVANRVLTQTEIDQLESNLPKKSMTENQMFKDTIFEVNKKLGFPRIMKLCAMTGKMKKHAIEEGITETDLVIVTVSTYSSGRVPKPGHYCFEKIIGNPVSYLLKRLYDTEEESKDRLEGLTSAD